MPAAARQRCVASFTAAYQTRAPELLCLFFDRRLGVGAARPSHARPQLLEALASPELRIAYDCAAKRFRAQFLCLLSRVLAAEVRRTGKTTASRPELASACLRDAWRRGPRGMETGGGDLPRAHPVAGEHGFSLFGGSEGILIACIRLGLQCKSTQSHFRSGASRAAVPTMLAGAYG